MQEEFDSFWIDFENSSNRNERATLLKITYNSSKISKNEFKIKIAQSTDYARSFNKKMILSGDYKLNYVKIDDKESLDTLFLPNFLDGRFKSNPSVSKSFIDCMITDIFWTAQQTNQLYLHPIKTGHLANVFKTKLKVSGKKLLSSKNYITKNHSEKLFKSNLKQKYKCGNFYQQRNRQAMIIIFS